MTLEQFEQLVKIHDITHEYSDDHGAWSKGQSQLDRINKESKNFPREEVVRIWNKYVDLKLTKDVVNQFYWE